MAEYAMKIVVLSHKECWPSPDSENNGYVTAGGFPFQMKALAELFTETTLVTSLYRSDCPPNAITLDGPGLRASPLPAPLGTDFRRKLSLLTWLPRYFSRLWRTVKQADAVHAPVPGDLGLIGIFLALAQGKPLFVRHCGTWGEPVTVADRFLLWLLERIAGGRNVVMATGGSDGPPSARNPAIQWIGSTTLTEAEMEAIPQRPTWRRGQPLRLVTVGRLSANKNTQAAIRSLALIESFQGDVTLDVVGDGPCRTKLRQLAGDLQLAGKVQFHGNTSHERVLQILQQGDIFLFPTRVKEGFPKAVLEALACGLPVVASGVSVLPHLIGERNGTVLPDPTAEALAEAVLALIADEGKLAALSRCARETSWKYTLENWQSIIRERLETSWGPLKEE